METKWSVHPPHPNVRTRKHNIVIHQPGVKKVTKNSFSVLECWKLFFPNNMIQEVVDCTNICLDKMCVNYGHERDCGSTTLAELSALLGLLYLAGVKKAQHLNIEEFFSDDGTAPECFRAVKNMKRFYLLLHALRFDNIHDRDERKLTDNLAPIRNIFQQFVTHCTTNYQVGEYVTVDETLEAFQGRSKFRQYIANKPAKYGLIVYALVDSRTFYTSNLEIYAGRQPEGPYKCDNKSSSVVNHIAAPIINTSRNITMDKYFTSLPLARELLQKNTTIVGTLRKNKKEIPPLFVNTKGRAQRSSMFAFSSAGTLVYYVPKINKNVLLLSTLHSDDKIDETSGSLKNLDYNIL
ncbi:piggyBac transposable element-derived protein 1-like [Bacillus rossius redtenbacheri]|uniref:piggyBac transposable element-derived protein 1-like n=1 Tax=Bacillus rossius redtenbacheri TaxID=93214 RepID=UPI002FDD7E33